MRLKKAFAISKIAQLAEVIGIFVLNS